MTQVELPKHAKFLIIGAGIHGLSTAWRLGEHLQNAPGDNSIILLDKTGIAAGASGIACGVVRNNYFQPAMCELMEHSVSVWESDPQGFSYNPVGYMQISHEGMHEDVASIHQHHRDTGYPSEFIEGINESAAYMRSFFDDWQATGITSVLHEHRGGYANNLASIQGLARKAQTVDARIHTGVTVTGFIAESTSGSIHAVETDAGTVTCEQVVVAVGPWIKSIWDMLDLPKSVTVKDSSGKVHEGIPTWRYWCLQEGVLGVDPDFQKTNAGDMPPVVHVDTDAPLHSDIDGRLITDKPWGVYYKPDFHFHGIQGGAMPYPVDKPADDVTVDPYGPESPEFIVGEDFADMWCSGLAFCQKRFKGQRPKFRSEPSGGLGCFTPDNFPVFDKFRENVYVIADSNHGYKMIGVGHLVANELLGETQRLLEPFRFSRYERGELHPVSNSPFPWS
ncbi:MAG: FAD-binding oxidoreductase [Hyphomicrobiales bacterium]|nr:FAD-binding oxidoreductase [Hyphomicrobiales bacterium]